MEPPGEPGTPDGLQGPESCIPSPRDKRLDGAMSTIIDASARPFPGPGLGEENDSCSHKSPAERLGWACNHAESPTGFSVTLTTHFTEFEYVQMWFLYQTGSGF